MRTTSLLGGLMAALLAACGEGVPPARYDVFTIELVGVTEGERVFPGQTLRFRTRYAGDLARNLQFKATFTQEASGESASILWAASTEDTTAIDEAGALLLRHEFLKRPGRIRVQLQASLTATRRGSVPWEARSPNVFVELYPTLDGIEVRPPTPGPPLPYGTPIEFQVNGADLWGEVGVTVLNVDTGVKVPGLEQVLPFDGSQSSLAGNWTIRARELEHVGTDHLRLVARYGDLEVQSEPLAFAVTHTIDEVTVLVRGSDGLLGPPTMPYPRLGQVTGLGVRVSGTLLAGHEVTVNGGPPVVASGDLIELMALVPADRDFADGVGRRTYDFVVRSGGMERTTSVTLQRWGIESCAWRATDGRPLGRSESIPRGTQVVMHASLWGFPDTTTTWFIFKSPQAEFTIWERDPGGRPPPAPNGLFQNNDDEVSSLDADVRSDQSEAHWTTSFQDEFDPLDLHLNSAEYDFDVQVEDQACTSGEMLVPSG